MPFKIVVEANQMEKRLEWASDEGPVSTRGDIIRWWEARRYTFNAFVFAVGFASWLLVMIAGSAAVKSGEDFVEPFAILDGAVMCIVIANACYTLGWVVDTVWYNGRPRMRLYKAELILAVALAALPGVWATVAWLITVYTGRKLD